MITACLDPGEHRTAVAVFDGLELVSLEWIEPGQVWPGMDLVDRIVIEKPRLYPGHPRPTTFVAHPDVQQVLVYQRNGKAGT